MTETARSIVLASRPSGRPTLDNFRAETHPVPEPGDGEFLARVLWLSLDPYMRGRMDAARSYAPPTALGAAMPGGCVAEIAASRHPGFAPGDVVVGPFGWTTHAVSDGTLAHQVDPAAAPLPAYLGALGMPGHTAWLSLNRVTAAQPGETLLVSAATGAVGGVLSQLAKARGLTVIGTAGGPEKCAYATAELGYDACIDHRAAADTAALAGAIAAAAPDGIEIYHDNVGGRTLEAAVLSLNDHARVAVCGMIAWFSGQGAAEAMPLPRMWRTILAKRLVVRGFLVFDHRDSFPEFLAEVAPMLASGRLRSRETVAEGLEAAPAAFLSMLEGGNFGKQLVRVADRA